ncbi:hypothetical protein BMETH_1363_0 [methanotrophic bacterial endosymbiont of Bathymodiolus sp.]|nr:hypothetical protein BMETH_1363_0 [methanotrophic bacterial endosymbiont of Bathymodiolus sp.]
MNLHFFIDRLNIWVCFSSFIYCIYAFGQFVIKVMPETMSRYFLKQFWFDRNCRF